MWRLTPRMRVFLDRIKRHQRLGDQRGPGGTGLLDERIDSLEQAFFMADGDHFVSFALHRTSELTFLPCATVSAARARAGVRFPQ